MALCATAEDESVSEGTWKPDWNVEKGEGGGSARNRVQQGAQVSRL